MKLNMFMKVWIFVCCYGTSVLALSFPWMVNDCGFEYFERKPDLDGYVYTVFKISSEDTSSALACVMDCFYDRTCMSVVYHGNTCQLYLTHMEDTYAKVAEATAVYTQFKDPDDCPVPAPVCDQNASCINKRQNDSCHCHDGYTGDGLTCTDENECLTLSPCDVNADCTNTVGSYTCACKSGYQGNGLVCQDIDECGTDDHTCDTNALCTNTVGAFTCTCNSMYQGNGHHCTLKPIRGESCTVDSNCIRSNFICSGGTCDCGVGYSYNGTSNTCETQCDVYGTEFSMQSSPYCVTGYNDAFYTINTFTGCRTKCLKASFTCRTFELWNDRCYLSSATKLTVPGSKWASWNGCKYYQRHCA